jgi:hypothetical protein
MSSIPLDDDSHRSAFGPVHHGQVVRPPPTGQEVTEAAAALRGLLAAIEAGEVDADSPQARALRRRLEGAAAWEEAVGQDRRK